jgi:D-alanine-D-alanine ligase
MHTDGVLIEEFIDGRELTCLVCENLDDPAHPHTFRPVEYLFPEGESFKHADMKWTNSSQLMPTSIHEDKMEQTLRDYSARMFAAMNGNGYARLDYRMDKNGNIYMLEINPNCGIFDDPKDPACADSILKNDPIGHIGFLDLILSSAIKRRDRIRAS